MMVLDGLIVWESGEVNAFGSDVKQLFIDGIFKGLLFALKAQL